MVGVSFLWSLVPIQPRISTILQVTPNAKGAAQIKLWTQLMTGLIPQFSGYAGGATQIPQANPINDKSCPNSTTNNQDSLGYAGSAAQIPPCERN